VVRAVRELHAADEAEAFERALAQSNADDVAKVLHERWAGQRVGGPERG
jgi:hypothetical protein